MVGLVYENRSVDLDEHVRSVVEIHAARTPFWKKYEKENDLDLAREIRGFDDLKKLPYLTDDDLRSHRPEEFMPGDMPEEERVLSMSSGTTGEHKYVYWSKGVVGHMVNYGEWALRACGFPEDERWVCTGPDNQLLISFLDDLCGRFKGKGNDYIKVDAGKAKTAFMSGDPALIKEFFDGVSGRVVQFAEEHGMGVYEDIAPLMVETARRLSEEKRLAVKGLLFGGVETTIDKIVFLRQQFPNAKIAGWYGDFMNGTGMMRTIDDTGITYQPFFPYVVWDIRKLDDVSAPAEYGERGEVISHRIGPDMFIPNRRTDDEAERVRPVEPLHWDALKDVTRLSRRPAP